MWRSAGGRSLEVNSCGFWSFSTLADVSWSEEVED